MPHCCTYLGVDLSRVTALLTPEFMELEAPGSGRIVPLERKMFCFSWFGLAWKNVEFFLLSSVPNCFHHKKQQQQKKDKTCPQYWGSERGGTNQGKSHYKRHSKLFSCCDMARGGRGKFLGWLQLETSRLSFCRENHQIFHVNCHLGKFHPASASVIISIY